MYILNRNLNIYLLEYIFDFLVIFCSNCLQEFCSFLKTQVQWEINQYSVKLQMEKKISNPLIHRCILFLLASGFMALIIVSCRFGDFYFVSIRFELVIFLSFSFRKNCYLIFDPMIKNVSLPLFSMYFKFKGGI